MSELVQVDVSAVTQQVDTLNYPLGGEVGDLVIVLSRGSAAAAPPSAGEFSDTFATLWSPGYDLGVAYRILDGTEGSTFTITDGSGVTHFLHIVLHVPNFTGSASDIVFADTADNATFDPPSVAGPTGAYTVLWIAGLGWQEDTALTVTYPTGYANTNDEHSGPSTPAIAYAWKTVDGVTTEDPSAFSLSGTPTGSYNTFTMGVAIVDATRWGFTITDIKEPNESNTLVGATASVTNARVLYWVDKADDVSAPVEIVNQTITNGAMTVEVSGSDGTNEPKMFAEWDAGGGETKFFRATPTIVDLDV